MIGNTLLYIPSNKIVSFVSDNPIDWDSRDLAKRGGPGDLAWVTPTPAVREFLRLLMDKRGLFTQRSYWTHCYRSWNGWIKDKPEIVQRGVRAKLYRNFYPSMIDSLHVWAMLCETGLFDCCILDSTDNAVGKTDLTA